MGKRGIGARKTPPGGPSWEFKGAQLREVLHKLQEPFLAGTSSPTSSQSKSAVRKEHSWSSSTFSLFSNFTTQHFGERVIKGPPPTTTTISQPSWMPLVRTICYLRKSPWVGKLCPHTRHSPGSSCCYFLNIGHYCYGQGNISSLFK